MSINQAAVAALPLTEAVEVKRIRDATFMRLFGQIMQERTHRNPITQANVSGKRRDRALHG